MTEITKEKYDEKFCRRKGGKKQDTQKRFSGRKRDKNVDVDLEKKRTVASEERFFSACLHSSMKSKSKVEKVIR